MCPLRRISLISSPRPSLMISTLPFANGLVCTPSTTQGLRGSVGMATAYFNRHSTYLDATMDFWTFLYDFYMAGISCQFVTLCVKLSAVTFGPPGTPDRPRLAQIGRIAQRRAQPLRSVFTLLFLLLYCSQ